MEVRLLEEKDLNSLSKVFNNVYKDYSMYNVNLCELYRHFADKDHQKEYMIVVEDNNTLLGYAAFGIRKVGSSAMVSLYDMVAVSKKTYDMLSKKVEEIGAEKGAAFIETFVPPKSDAAAWITSTGFLEIGAAATMVYVVDMKEIVTAFVENAVLTRDFKKEVTVLFCVGKERITVKLPEGIVYGDKKGEPDVKVTISLHDLLSALLKKTSCFSLILKGRMKVNPGLKIVAVCSVVNYLAEDVKMIAPFIDLM